MPKRIDKLTPEQKSKMAGWAQRWIAIGLKTGETDWATFDKYMPVCYEKAGLKYPKKVVRVSSPIVGALAASIANQKLNDDAVHDAVHDAVSGVVDGAVRDAVDDAVSGSVSGSVRGVVDGAVGDAVDDAVDDAVSGVVRDAKLEWHYWLGGQFWVGGFYYYGSPCMVSFLMDVCDLELSKDISERQEAYQKVCESVNYVWANKDFVMVCARPVKINRDVNGRLHSTTEKSIEYPDGWGLFHIHGVRFEENIWKQITSGTMPVKDVLALSNIEQRYAAMKFLGAEKLLTGAKAKLIDDSIRGNRLYETSTLIPGTVMKFLRYLDPSTGREYVSFVPPEHTEADAAMAWKFSMNPKEYPGLEHEA